MGKVAIVTGASSGIGRATAIRLARDFDAVALVARNRGGLEETGADVKQAGAMPLIVDADLGEAPAAAAVVMRTLEAFGRVDAVLNIAGAVPGIDLFELTDAQWDNAMALKLHGARRVTMAAWNALKASGGSAIFVAGSAADVPVAVQAAIGTINAAIVALAKAFADRGLADGVQVNSVSPGPIMTGRRLGMIEKMAAAKGISVEEAKAAVLAEMGLARFGSAEEVAELMGYLVSGPAKWLTGATLRIDGGEVKSI
jgi:3-oxoacyl-[acyl-carrier protein] reductase